MSTGSLPRLERSPGQRYSPAIYGYAVQIYADFSGYTDIAIGLALLLGFRFPQNFDRPYIADVPPGLLAPVAYDPVAFPS